MNLSKLAVLLLLPGILLAQQEVQTAKKKLVTPVSSKKVDTQTKKKSVQKQELGHTKVQTTAASQVSKKPIAQPAPVETEKKDVIPPTLYPVDRIEVVIFGPESTEIITFGDISCLGLDGQSRTKDDVIYERLMYLDAVRHRVMIDEKSIDEYIDKVKKSFNLTTDAIKKLFESAGYTYEEGRRQFGYMQAAERMREYKVLSRLIVPEKDVKEYYDEHPVIRPATFIVEKAFVPVPDEEKPELRKKLQKQIAAGTATFDWQRMPEVAEADLADDKKMITRLSLGQISELQDVDGGFELYKLVQKKNEEVVTLEERYRDIVEVLRKPKFEKLNEQYRDSLFKSASMLMF